MANNNGMPTFSLKERVLVIDFELAFLLSASLNFRSITDMN